MSAGRALSTKILLGAVAGGLCASAFAAVPAAAKHDGGSTRTETHAYAHASGVRTSHWDYAGDDLDLPGLVFHPRPGDRYVKFEYDDAVGTIGFIFMKQAGRGGLRGDYCGAEGVFKLESHKPIEVRVLTGLCDNHLFAVATRGTVTATFADFAIGAVTRRHHDHAP